MLKRFLHPEVLNRGLDPKENLLLHQTKKISIKLQISKFKIVLCVQYLLFNVKQWLTRTLQLSYQDLLTLLQKQFLSKTLHLSEVTKEKRKLSKNRKVLFYLVALARMENIGYSLIHYRENSLQKHVIMKEN